MSKIGRVPIEVPEQVTVRIKDGEVSVAGPKGELDFRLPFGVKVKKAEDKLLVTRESDEAKARALHGTVRQHIANMVKGVSEGWAKTLEIVGTGYRASLEGEKLVLSVGFSHPVEVLPPEGIRFEVAGGKIKVSGIDRVLVGQVAAKVRKIKPPDPYKGKGIRYEQEVVKLKPGKAAKIGVGIAGVER